MLVRPESGAGRGKPVARKAAAKPKAATAKLTAFRKPAPPKPHPSKSVFLPSVGKPGKGGGIATPVSWTPAPTPSGPGRVSIPHPGQPASPYVNPFAGVTGLSAARIDMGVDYFGKGKIGAIGPGKITASGNAWQGAVGAPNPGTWITEQITAGPLKGKQVYVAEDVQSLVKTGQTVKAGQPIAQFVAGTGGVHNALETGFAAPGAAGRGGETMAAYAGQAASGGDPGAVPTAWGIAYAKVLKALKVPTVAIPASGTGTAPSFGIGGKAGRVSLPPSLPPIVIPSGVNPPATGAAPSVAVPKAAAAPKPSKVKAAVAKATGLPGPTSPPVSVGGTSPGTTTTNSGGTVTTITTPPDYIYSSTGTGGFTYGMNLAQPVASGTTGASSNTTTLLLAAGAGVILLVILLGHKKGK